MGQRKCNGFVKIGYRAFLTEDDQEIYVSPNGDDNNGGTFSSPVRTLEKALELAESFDNSTNGVDIFLRDGVYFIDDTINISYTGENYAPLRIRAYGNENAVLNGGFDILLSDMEEASAEFTDKIIDKPSDGAILQYDLAAAGITDYGEISRRGHLISEDKEAQAELSLDGKVQRLAAWPNDGFKGLIKPDEYGKRNASGIANGCSFTVDYDRPSLWSRQSEAWLCGTLGPNYEFDHYPMSRFNSEEKKVYLREGAVVQYYTKPYYKFENIPEELDSEGEYYIDRDNGMLYFYPPKSAKKDSVLTITMPTENQKEYSGKKPNDIIRLENCSNVIFENLTIKGGRGSAVTGRSNNNIIFKDCDINSVGANGIRLDYSNGIEVRNCKIHDVGQDGMQFTNCGDYANIISNNIMVCNNDIYNFARLERSYKAGINFGYRSVGATAARNHVHDGPHTGMIFYGVNNDIYGNEFDNLVTEFCDMDAVYANNSCYPWERGNKIHGNYFHDIGRSTLNGAKQINVRAIRSDNKGCGLKVFGNIFYKIGDGNNNNIGAVTAEGTRNKIFENLFVDCSETYINGQAYREIETQSDGTLYADDSTINGASVASLKSQMKSYLPIYGNQFPELYNFFYEHPNNTKTNEFKNNIIINVAFGQSQVNGGQTAEGFRGDERLTEAEGNVISDEKSLFVSYDNEDFELTQNNLTAGYVNSPMSCYGLIQ